jgi:RNA polymerase sigma factor (TIGR02999 family)
MTDSADITLLLDAAREGDRGALDNVLARLYTELHSMARRQLAGQHGQTLDATALVHEAYLKLIGRREAKFDDRAHFFAYAASAMRSVVVDYARQRLAQKAAATCTVSPTCPRMLKAACAWTRRPLASTPP